MLEQKRERTKVMSDKSVSLSFYVGYDNRPGSPEREESLALETVLEYFPEGATVVSGFGAWRDTAGDTIIECSVIVTVITTVKLCGARFRCANALAREFDQTAVLVSMSDVNPSTVYRVPVPIPNEREDSEVKTKNYESESSGYKPSHGGYPGGTK